MASIVSSLTVNGTLDLTDNGLIITGATTTLEGTIAGLIQTGSHSGTWTGTGITSSVVAAHPSLMTIAYDFASNIGLTFTGGLATWGGQTISQAAAGSDLLLLPTLIGDVNMDGTVNATDYFALTPNLGKSGQTWGTGSIAGGTPNGTGTVNATDYFALTPNLGKSVSGLSPNYEVSSGDATATPEPASLVLLAMAGVLWARSPRRRA
jgi:hypothetical protein